MTTGKLIEYYKAIENESARMLEAARAADWQEVVRFEQVCATLIAQLRSQARSEILSPEQSAEKTKIMQRILKNDAQIRTLAEPWLAQQDDAVLVQKPTLH